MSVLSNFVQAPNAILYPKDYLPTINAAQTEVIDSFVKDLENELGIARTEISLAEEWKKSRPASVQESDVNEYLKEVSKILCKIYCQTNGSTRPGLFLTTKSHTSSLQNSETVTRRSSTKHRSYIEHYGGDGR